MNAIALNLLSHESRRGSRWMYTVWQLCDLLLQLIDCPLTPVVVTRAEYVDGRLVSRETDY